MWNVILIQADSKIHKLRKSCKWTLKQKIFNKVLMQLLKFQIQQNKYRKQRSAFSSDRNKKNKITGYWVYSTGLIEETKTMPLHDQNMRKKFLPLQQVSYYPELLEYSWICSAYLGGGGTWDFAKPTHATMPTASIIHPKMSYLRSLLFLFFAVCYYRL